ncbi:MAG: hypothetical protein ACXW08_14330 [Solirubrobacteraceae bacterium]|jgi:hypothetical protein
MTTTELRTHVLALEAERAAASIWGLDELASYTADLEGEIEATRIAYVASAVTEIASFRAALSGPQLG